MTQIGDPWSLLAPTPNRSAEASVSELLADLRSGARAQNGRAVLPTGYNMLDRALEGGLHTGDLVVLAGMPGVGKTIAALQWARNLARGGATVLYLCYEHDVDTLLARLLACEIGDLDIDLDQESMAASHQAVRSLMARRLEDPSTQHPVVKAALSSLAGYADRLVLSHLVTSTADLQHIENSVLTNDRTYDAVFVDYLQKVPSSTASTTAERIRHTVEGIKNLAVAADCAIVGLSAVGVDELGQHRRLRLDGLQGAAVVTHEADMVITLNPKLSIVSKNHLAFDATRFEEFDQTVVFTIEKNRRGLAPLDLEFEKDFQHFRFEPTGRFVAERLVDNLLTLE